MNLLQESNEKVKLLKEQHEQQECQRKLLLKELEQQQSELTERNENCDKVLYIIYHQPLSLVLGLMNLQLKQELHGTVHREQELLREEAELQRSLQAKVWPTS